MEDYTPRFFSYAHSNAIMEALKDCVRNRRGAIGADYGFVEKNGETIAFNDMIELAKLGGGICSMSIALKSLQVSASKISRMH